MASMLARLLGAAPMPIVPRPPKSIVRRVTMTQPGEMDDDEHIGLAFDSLDQMISVVWPTAPVTSQLVRRIAILMRQTGFMSQSELVEKTGSHVKAISNVANLMERQGWLIRGGRDTARVINGGERTFYTATERGMAVFAPVSLEK